MGCDIHGAFENIRSGHTWHLCRLSGFVGRDYRAFGSLFGVRNHAQFEPLFADRGFPTDMSWRLLDEVESWGADRENPNAELGRIDFHSASWLTLDELDGVNWDEEADAPDSHYTLLDENHEPLGGFGWSSAFEEFIEEHQTVLATGEKVRLPDDHDEGPGRMLRDDDAKFIQRRVWTRREAMGGAWQWLLFEFAPLLADRYGAENVRLTVWFDN